MQGKMIVRQNALDGKGMGRQSNVQVSGFKQIHNKRHSLVGTA